MSYQPPPNPLQPPGPPYGPPGYGYPPTAAPRRRRWPLIVGGIFLAFIVGCVGLTVAGVFGAVKVASTSGGNTSGRNAVAGKMGSPARDGKFEFTVTKLECGKKTIGSGLFVATAQGSYCLVTVKVRNIGQEAQSFDGSSQKAYAGTTQFSNDGTAEFNYDSGTSTWDQQINPGNQVTGTLVYDVPQGTKLTSIELHDSFLSGGVNVPLK